MELQEKLNQGMALHQQGRLADAERIYREVLRQRPNHHEALHMLGVIAYQTGHLERAIALIGKAIELNASVAVAHNNLGNALSNQNRFEEALASYDRAIVLKPDYAQAYSDRGNVLRNLKRHEDALASYDRAIALKREYAIAYFNRALVLQDLKRHEDALASYGMAIALKPSFAEAHSNHGLVLQDLKRHEDALASYDRAIVMKPDYAISYFNRGVVLQDLKRHEEAVASYDRATVLTPDFAGAYWNQSLCLLQLGHFEQGWRQYEWRKRLNKSIAARCYPQPHWFGEQNIMGKTLFIWWELGFGDTIQFSRYVKLVADLGAKVILEVPKPLMSLFVNLAGVPQLVEEGSSLPSFDYQCALMSLPLAFKTTLSNIPANIPYIKANVEKSLFWKNKLGEKNIPRVGLVWSGGFRPNQPEVWAVNSRRNIPLAKLAALKNLDIDFYSLQKGQPAESELVELIRDNWDGPQILDFTNLVKDFSDTAALIENLDLVISVDTSTAHLAGALGKPVWILNRYDACWRWLLDRADSPWYPTAKLYRQEKAGDWDAVIQRVKTDLTDLLASQCTSRQLRLMP